MGKPKNYKELVKFKKELELKEHIASVCHKKFENKRTGFCPICKTEVPEEVEKYVKEELAKGVKDPNYVAKTYSGDK